MIRKIHTLIFAISLSCQAQKSIITEHLVVKIYTYKDGNEIKASPMPELIDESKLVRYKRRFDYLIINVPEIHASGKFEERKKIFDLYPDSLEMKRLYMEKIIGDEKFVKYFETAAAPIINSRVKTNTIYSINEMMEVASRFFYCDKVNPDTSIQSHVCIGLNGLSEAKWEKDYTLLSAFCFEAIFHDLDKNRSQIRKAYYSEKSKSSMSFRKSITSLDNYLENVKMDLFSRMKNSVLLRKKLLAYYKSNKNNLAFKIIK